METVDRAFFRKLWVFLVLVITATGCYDDSALWRQINEHEARLVKLEILTEEFNTNLSSLQSVLTVLKEGDFVTNVTPVERGGKEVGLTITFFRKNPVTIYFGEVSVGDLGGNIPEIGIAKDTDGDFYWTINGSWIVDDSGNYIPASGKPGADGDDGITPKLKIQNDKWYVSYDNGGTWEQLGDVASGDNSIVAGPGGCVFSNVKVGENSVTLILADGTEIVVPKKFKATFEASEPKFNSVIISGVAKPHSPDYEVGVYYSTDSKVQVQKSEKVSCVDFDSDNRFSIKILGLKPGTTYYWRSYVSMYGDVEYGDVMSFTTATAPDMGFVSSLTSVMTTLEGEKRRSFYEYGYDEEFRVSSFNVIYEYYGENLNSTFEYGTDGSVAVNMQYSDGGSSESVGYTAQMNTEGWVTRISAPELYAEVDIEYLTDGLQDRASCRGTGSYKYEDVYKYTYVDGALSSMMLQWSGDMEKEVMSIEVDEFYAHRYRADNININLNLLLMLAEWGNPYLLLSHVGLCGTMLGNFLMEKTEAGGAIKEDYFNDQTEDKNYCEHVRVERYEQEGEFATVEYQFNENSRPVKIVASTPYHKYAVEYDLKAGNRYEWSDEENPIYEVVKINEKKEYLRTEYSTYEYTISYVGETNSSIPVGN